MTAKREKPGSPYLATRNEIIGATIARAREMRGLNQADVAAQMRDRGAEWSPSTLWALESGRQSLRAAEIADLAAVLGLPVGDLIAPDDAALEFRRAVSLQVTDLNKIAERLTNMVWGYQEAARFTNERLDELAQTHPDHWATLNADAEAAGTVERIRTRTVAQIVEGAVSMTSEEGTVHGKRD